MATSVYYRQQQLEQERLDRELALRLAEEDTSQVEQVAAPLVRYVPLYLVTYFLIILFF